MKIRSYQETDFKEVYQLFCNTVRKINIKDYSKEQINNWALKNPDENKWQNTLLNNYSIVAIIDQQIVGFSDVDNNGYLDHLYIHHLYLRQGIASSLLNEIKRYVIDLGINLIDSEASITALPFFKQQGFNIIKKQEVEKNKIIFTNFLVRKIL
jgi:Acetyltransferases